MNWLILASDVQNKDIKKIEELIEKYSTEYQVNKSCASKINSLPQINENGVEEYCQSFSEKSRNIEEFFITDSLDNKNFEVLSKLCCQSSHCIILDGEKIADLKIYAYILGLLVGNKSSVFICNSDENKTEQNFSFENYNLSCNSLVKKFKSVSDLENHLSENYFEYEKLVLAKQCLKDLITEGIPFTADSFAFYAAKDNIKICSKFLAAGMNVNTFTSDGVPLLCVATRNDCKNTLMWLLENGADLNIVSKDRGYSPVMDAVWRRNYELTQLLVEKGADLSIISSDGQPILVLAVGNGNEKIVKLLLENGADAEITDSMGMNARSYAALFKKVEIMELMEKFSKK